MSKPKDRTGNQRSSSRINQAVYYKDHSQLLRKQKYCQAHLKVRINSNEETVDFVIFKISGLNKTTLKQLNLAIAI